MAHRGLVIAAQYISFDAGNIQLSYKQSGVPGPRPGKGSPLEGTDAICLEIRKLALQPQGKRYCTWNCMHDFVVSLCNSCNPASLCAHDTLLSLLAWLAMGTLACRMCWHIQDPGRTELFPDKLMLYAEAPRLAPAHAEGIESRQFANAPGCDAAAPDNSWRSWAMHVPKWMWGRIVVRMPVSSRLQLAGVNVSLREYQKPHTRHRQEAQAPSSNLGTPAASSPHVVSHPVVSLQPHASHTQQPETQHQSHGHSRPQPENKPYRVPQTADEPVGQPERVASTYTLLRQWGAEVMVTIQPPGWAKETTHDDGPHVSAPGQPYQLRTKTLKRLNSIWESQEGSGDEGTPTSSSGVRSLFSSQPNGHPGHAQAQPGSPGLLFTNRQNNPLCES